MRRLKNPFFATASVIRNLLFITMLLLLGGVIPAHALPASDLIEAKGTVADEHGEALPGVTVTQSGTKNVVVTDLDGLYSIKVPRGSVLEFTYIGKNPAKVTVNASKTYDVTLYDNETMLDEVMVTGYSTISKAQSTGSFQKTLRIFLTETSWAMSTAKSVV